MPKQGGPYSWASASTLGTLGPSRQIGLISSESVSCEPPFNVEINIATADGGEGGQQSSHSQAVCQSALTSRTDGRTAGSVLVGRRGPQPAGFPLGRGQSGRGADRSLKVTMGQKWEGKEQQNQIFQIMAKERRKR